MRQHFLPRAEPKYASKDTPKRFMVVRANGYPIVNLWRKPIEKPSEKAFRRRQRVKSQNRYWAINVTHLGRAFSASLMGMSERTGILRRLFETPEERVARRAQELETWKERYLAKQRYLVPHLHPKNMMKPADLFNGRIGRIESFNVITDSFVAGGKLEQGDLVHIVDGKCVKIEHHPNEDSIQ